MPEDFSVNVRGEPREIQFPALCVNCCQPATQCIAVERAFCTDSEEDSWKVVRFSPLFCRSCIEKQSREARPISPVDRIIMALKTRMALAMAGPLLFGGFLIFQSLKTLVESGDPVRASMPALFGFFFVLIGVWCFVIALGRTAHKAIAPQTSVTGAIQFTDDMSATFEPTWRRFTFRNAEYGKAFADLNRSRLWDKHGPDAIKAASRRFDLKVAGAIAAGILVLYWIYDDFLRQFLQ